MARIFETLVTTRGPDGRAHIAPMGLREGGEDLWLLAPFRPSATLENLTREGVAVVNLCTDVRIFAGCLTGRRDWPVRPAEVVGGWVLEAALGHYELSVERVEDGDGPRPRFYCHERHRASHGLFPGLNRAQAAVIEAAVLVSRLGMLSPEKIGRELEYLSIAVDKTAGPQERQAWGWLLARIEAHRQSHGADADRSTRAGQLSG